MDKTQSIESALSSHKLWLETNGCSGVQFNLSGECLSKADLSEADLSGANLSGVDLRRANLLRTRMENAKFAIDSLEQAGLTTLEYAKPKPPKWGR